MRLRIGKKDAKILIIEDDIYIAKAVRAILKLEGYDVETASSGSQGLQYIETFAPDLVLLDIMLPDITGLEVASAINGKVIRGQISRPAVIFMTAMNQEADIAQGLACGADGYVIKPFDPSSLLSLISTRIQTGGSSSEESNNHRRR